MAVYTLHHAAKGIDEVLKLVGEAEASGRKVVLHCWGGSGRTGTVLAAVLVS